MVIKRCFFFVLCVVMFCTLSSTVFAQGVGTAVSSSQWLDEGKQRLGSNVDWADYEVEMLGIGAGDYKLALCRVSWQMQVQNNMPVLVPVYSIETFKTWTIVQDDDPFIRSFTAGFFQPNPPANAEWELTTVVYRWENNSWKQKHVDEHWFENCGNNEPKD